MRHDAICSLIELFQNPECKLEKLELDEASLNEEDTEQFIKALPPSLKLLRIISDFQDNILLRWLKSFPRWLEGLNLYACQLSEELVVDLAEYLQQTRVLKMLDVSRNKAIGQSLDFMKSLPHSLEELSMNQCDLSKQSVLDLAKYVEIAQNLKVVSVIGNEMVGHEFAFAQAFAKSTIKKLCTDHLSNKFLESFMEQRKSDNENQPAIMIVAHIIGK